MSETLREVITGAVARGWCHADNAGKVMDAPLALAIVDQVLAALEAQGVSGAPEPTPRGFPSEPSAEHDAWVNEAMRQINALTPNVTGKMFDPDWFLLRQHLESYPLATPESVHLRVIRAALETKGGTADPWARENAPSEPVASLALCATHRYPLQPDGYCQACRGKAPDVAP